MSETTAPTTAVLRQSVPIDDRIHEVPPGRIVAVDQRDPEHLDVWFIPEPVPEHLAAIALVPNNRQLLVVGTGHPFPAEAQYIDKALSPLQLTLDADGGIIEFIPRGQLVWHLLDVTPVTHP